jgi:uncharacterized repeat protein (TIGR03803 family)
MAGLIEASDGALYGTAPYGGSASGGIVFRINKDGTGFSKLHDFDEFDWANGRRPDASVIEHSDGLLYGTTSLGGGDDVGTIFRIKKDGTDFRKLHDFAYADPANGAYADAGLVEGSDHNLFGTASGGGPSFGGIVYAYVR